MLDTNTLIIIISLVNCSIAEDNMNVQLRNVTVTAREGHVSHLEQVYVRGSHVRMFVIPDALKYVTFCFNIMSFGTFTNRPSVSIGMLRCLNQKLLLVLEAHRKLPEDGAEEVDEESADNHSLLVLLFIINEYFYFVLLLLY